MTYILKMRNVGNKSYVLINMQDMLSVGGNISTYEGFILIDNYDESKRRSVSDIPISNLPLKMQAYTLMVCTQGELKFRLDYDQPVCINSGDLFFFQSGQIVEFKSSTNDTRVFHITVSKENMINLLHNVPNDCLPKSQTLKLDDSLMNEIQLYYNLMRSYIDSSDLSKKKDVLRAYLYIILMKIGCEYKKYFSTSERIDTSGMRKMEIYHRFVSEVKANFKEHRDVEFYASSLCLSAGHLSRIIKAISGKTIGSWIRDYVILEAKVMLQTSDLTISQISDSLNFPNPSFFSKYFREATGTTPGQYRKSYTS